MSILPLDSFIKRIPDEPPCYILQVLSPFKERLMLILNKLFSKQVKSFRLVGSRSFYFPVFTSQHKVHQVHKSTRYFHQSHAAFPQFVSFPSNFVQSRIYLYFLKPLQNRSKFDQNCAQLSPSL